MSVAAMQAQKFYKQAVSEGRVFTFLDEGAFLVYPVGGAEVVPFWSSRSRLTTIQESVAEVTLRPRRIELNPFLVETIPEEFGREVIGPDDPVVQEIVTDRCAKKVTRCPLSDRLGRRTSGPTPAFAEGDRPRGGTPGATPPSLYTSGCASPRP